MIVSREIGIKDDGSYPSRFFLENERSELFDAAMISSDYENFTMIWMKEDEVGKWQVSKQTRVELIPSNNIWLQEFPLGDYLRSWNRKCVDTHLDPPPGFTPGTVDRG